MPATTTEKDSTLTPKPPLLEQVRRRIRTKRLSRRTEQAYIHWVKRYIRHHEIRHPADMGAPEVEAFLSWLATDRQVSATAQNLDGREVISPLDRA